MTGLTPLKLTGKSLSLCVGNENKTWLQHWLKQKRNTFTYICEHIYYMVGWWNIFFRIKGKQTALPSENEISPKPRLSTHGKIFPKNEFWSEKWWFLFCSTSAQASTLQAGRLVIPSSNQLLEEIRACYGKHSLTSHGISWDHRKQSCSSCKQEAVQAEANDDLIQAKISHFSSKCQHETLWHLQINSFQELSVPIWDENKYENTRISHGTEILFFNEQ